MTIHPLPPEGDRIMSLQQFATAAEGLDRYTDSLRFRIWTELAEAHSSLLEREPLPEGAPSHEELAARYLDGIRETIAELMYACDLAYRALGLSQPFGAYFQYVHAPVVVRRCVRRLLGEQEPASEPAPVKATAELPSNAGGEGAGGLPECN
jgi:hypothetical protein